MLEQTVFPNIYPADKIVRDDRVTTAVKIKSLISAMSIEEKLGLLHGWPDPAEDGKIGVYSAAPTYS